MNDCCLTTKHKSLTQLVSKGNGANPLWQTGVRSVCQRT